MKHFLFILIIIATALIISPSEALPGDPCSFSWQCMQDEVCIITKPDQSGYCAKIEPQPH